MHHADGLLRDKNWLKYGTWATNTMLHAMSPWGPALLHYNGAGGNDGAGLEVRTSPWTSFITPGNTNHFYTVFAIIRDAGGTTNRAFLTHKSSSVEFLKLSIVGTTGLLNIVTGPPGFSTIINHNIADYLRDDGWYRLAVVLHAAGATHGAVDLWVEGTRLYADTYGTSLDLWNVAAVIAGCPNDYKTGFSFYGDIAQLACIFTGGKKMSDDQIIRWFDDPWWFLKAERSMWIPSRRTPYGEMSIEPAADGEMSFLSSASAEMSIEPAVDAEMSIKPASDATLSIEPAVDGEMSITPPGRN